MLPKLSFYKCGHVDKSIRDFMSAIEVFKRGFAFSLLLYALPNVI